MRNEHSSSTPELKPSGEITAALVRVHEPTRTRLALILGNNEHRAARKTTTVTCRLTTALLAEELRSSVCQMMGARFAQADRSCVKKMPGQIAVHVPRGWGGAKKLAPMLLIDGSNGIDVG